MKNHLIVLIQKKLSAAAVMLFMLALPLIGISQTPPPGPPGGGGPADAVPFDDNMNLLFLAAGLVFAMVVVVKQLQQRKKANA